MPETTPETELQGIRASYAMANPKVKIAYLVYHRKDRESGEVLVYIDNEFDLDWEMDSKAGTRFDGHSERGRLEKCKNSVARLEPIATSWPKPLKLTSKRLLGEVIAHVLRCDANSAEDALRHARAHILEKSKQVSRYWILQGCFTAATTFAASGLVALILRDFLSGLFGETTYWLAICFCAGTVDALLFVTLGMRRQVRVNSTADRRLHYFEAVSRLIAGGISGILIGALIKLGLILPLLKQSGSEELTMCTAAIIAGASERFAAGVITKVENHETLRMEAHNDSN